MRSDQRKNEIRRGLNIQFGETALDHKTFAVEEENFIRVRAARDNGQPAQHGNVEVGVETLDMNICNHNIASGVFKCS